MPDRSLLQLVYVSRQAPWLQDPDFEAIARVSRARNARAGLSGLLLCQGCWFYAVLEGPQSVLLQRMEVIITDRRHSRVRILSETTVPARRFSNWSFGRLPGALAAAAASDGAVPPPDAFILSLARRLAS